MKNELFYPEMLDDFLSFEVDVLTKTEPVFSDCSDESHVIVDHREDYRDVYGAIINCGDVRCTMRLAANVTVKDKDEVLLATADSDYPLGLYHLHVELVEHRHCHFVFSSLDDAKIALSEISQLMSMEY